MRICVFGAGAVGGNFAVRLANAGHEVCVVARGAHLDAIRSRGLTLIAAEETMHAQVAASDDPAELGAQDLVLSTLKAPSLPGLADAIGPLLRADTAVLFAQNGIPWWYADGLGSAGQSAPDLSMLDPGNRLRDAVGLERTIGGVIYSSNDQVEPGVVVNNSPSRNRLLVSEIDGAATARIQRIRAVLSDAGISSPEVEDLRQLIWEKLLANLSVSVLAFLTERTSREVFDSPDLAPVVSRLAAEGLAVAHAHGVQCARNTAAPAANHKSSMLQDFERGRAIETDALIGAPLAFAKAAGIDTPAMETIAALVMNKLRSGPKPA